MKLKLVNTKSPQKLKLNLVKDVVREGTKQGVKDFLDSGASGNDEYRVGASNYSRYKDPRDHIYNISDSYVGSDTRMERHERVLNLETGLFEEKEISLTQGVERIFVEISSNAGDNVARSLRQGIDPGEVTITMDRHTIKVRNGGIPIPIEMHPDEENMYAPELIFGNLFSSSNYDKTKTRTECGRNGFGAKLTNIFSKDFHVTIADHHNGLLYKQHWSDNMKTRRDPVITKLKEGVKPFVEIVYTMDFERFGYAEYPDEAFELFARHCADMAFALKIPVSFNGKKFLIKNAKDYAKIYLGKEAVKSSILYLKWPPGTETYTKKGVEYSVDESVLPIVEVCAIDTPDEAIKVAFANGMWTRNGGVHFEAAFKAVADGVLESVNDVKKKKKKGEKVIKLTMNDVKKHISLIVSCWVGDPKFDSQSKLELKSPAMKITIDEKILAPIMKWDLLSRLYAELDAKHFREETKTDGKKRRDLSGMDKLEDANKAGTAESANCTLYVTEGDSALTFAMRMCSFIPGGKGRDYIGGYPLKGKPLNVMNASADKIRDNKVIADLKKVLGIREGIDYTVEENFQTLRYGHLMVLSDADTDGTHILGLVINLFHCKYPSLLARGYIKYLRTKILEVSKGKGKNSQKLKFYTQHEYDIWKAQTPDYLNWEHRYLKGLGTSTDEEIEEESRDPRIVMSVYDELAPYSLRLAFDQDLTNNRKTWIKEWVPDYSVEDMKIQPISSFINHQFIQFSIADVARSIPRFTDGLKTSQRKIMWAALKKWKNKGGEDATISKVAQFAAYVSQELEYKHGEKSLEGAIVGMAQDFVGANNLTQLYKKGQFGTRFKLGKDASAARYIFTRPTWSVPLIYRKEDIPLLDFVIDEGKELEPVTLLPVIPMHLINGCLGIGTGTSTYIPPHNPTEIVSWLECKLKGMPTPELVPWFRGFEGEVEMKIRGKDGKDGKDGTEGEGTSDGNTTDTEGDSNGNTEGTEGTDGTEGTEEDLDDSDEVLISKNTKVSVVTKGEFELGSRKKVIVKELPIGRSIHSYKVFLDKMRDEKKITKFQDYSTPDKPHFEIYGVKNPSKASLKLIKSYGMSNMVLLDNNDRPVKYENATMILETFYTIRLAYYVKRKDYMIADISNTIAVLNAKIDFILAVIQGYNLLKQKSGITDLEANQAKGILTIGRNKKDIGVQMERCGFDPEILKKVTLYQCTDEQVQKNRDEIDKHLADKKKIEETRPEEMWLSDLADFMRGYNKHY